MTVHGLRQKAGHLGNDVVMIIVKVQINSLLWIGTNINKSVLMFFGYNIDLVIGKVRLKQFDFIQSTGTQRDVSFFM
jgi:hypothetical protein